MSAVAELVERWKERSHSDRKVEAGVIWGEAASALEELAAALETRQHVVARMQHRIEFDLSEMWFEDGMAVAVTRREMDIAMRASGLADQAVLVTGATATLEKVEGRWVLARLELKK